MSSILAALKKVAHDTPPSPSRPSPAGSLDIQEAVNARVNRRIRRRRMISTAIALVVVAGIGFAAYNIPWRTLAPLVPWPFSDIGKNRERPPWPPSGIVARSKTASELPPSNPEPTSADRSESYGPSDSQQAMGGTATDLYPAKASRAIVAVTPTAGRKAEKFLPSKDNEPLWLKNNLQSARQRATPEPTPGSRVPKPKRGGHTPPPITDPPVTANLRLQALAWSADMVRRMAVVNDLVVREGDWVAGFQVVSIHQEKVVLSDGRRSFHIGFSQ